ncbi:hypothetical protein PARHAE_03954 [Paracoccus haematequi]|uniref:Uncharacterized protein n=1 Tax=Paracoccus haematequi TaxID=2491866 RepID=A0A3S4DEP7_9RHOB|nr:hypothetical protein [Paracoccus haematequi]VDS10735.1 hypothetical protein PARHAE_03954 [Paracoccus haematequi]
MADISHNTPGMSGETITSRIIRLSDEAQTDILRLLAKHQALTEEAERHIQAGHADEDGQRFAAQIADLEDKMMALPSTCAADFAAKAIALTANGQSLPRQDQEPFWAEARALVEEGARPTIPATRMGRLKFAADTLGLDLPENLKTNLLAEDASLQTEVLLFCAATGVSLDFIYFADIKPMLRSAFNRRHDQHRDPDQARTEKDMSEATEYLDGLQRKAVKARGLMGAIAALGDEPEEEDTLFELVDTATRILGDLERGLDAVSRPAALVS